MAYDRHDYLPVTVRLSGEFVPSNIIVKHLISRLSSNTVVDKAVNGTASTGREQLMRSQRRQTDAWDSRRDVAREGGHGPSSALLPLPLISLITGLWLHEEALWVPLIMRRKLTSRGCF